MGSLLGCSLVALLLAGSGMDARPVETTIQDDAVLLHRTEPQVRRALRQIQELGADRVRLTAGWSALAPSPRATHQPGKPFDPTDSRTYPDDGWDELDRAVRGADDTGLAVQLDIAFWAPRWAVATPGRQADRQRYIPSAAKFADFARAVARRYNGTFPDPHRHGRHLPAVRLYTTWNEPNHPSFLSPQFKRSGHTQRASRAGTGGSFRPFSPHVYRAMHEAAYAAIKSVSKDDQVLIGGLSSMGSGEPGRGGVPPLEFMRAMACVDGAMQPLAVPECKGAGPLHADGFALHPYSLDTTPGDSSPNPDEAPIGDLDRVEKLIDALFAAGRIDHRWNVYLTEYGYETKPPDPTARYTPEQQARYLGWATFLADRDPHVEMFAQFLLRDIDPADSGFSTRSKRRWRDWQTGLLYADGRPKPAAQAFKIPLYATYAVGGDGQPALMLHGGVRPGTGRKVVRVERQDPQTGAWAPVHTTGTQCDETDAEFLTDGNGFFTRTASWDGPGRYRLGWEHGGRLEYGAEIPVSADEPLLIGP